MTPSTLQRSSTSLTRVALGLSALVLSLAANAQVANPYQRGPAPTEAALDAAKGPFAVATSKIATPSGFGGGTVYYPSSNTEGPFGVIALAPGFVSPSSAYTWLATRVASHGFVVVNIDTTTLFDQPESRAKQLAAALKQVVALGNTTGSPFKGKIDASRQAVMGHSMGGGATLAAARDNPSLKAAVPLTPWHTTKDFSAVKVPTLIVACETDAIAPNDTHSDKFYSSLTFTLDKAFLELAKSDHFCPTSLANATKQNVIAKTTVSWFKRFVDNDTRYTPFVKTVDDAIVLKYETGGGF